MVGILSHSKITEASAAARLVADGATLAIGASSGISLPDATMAAIGERFAQTGAPGNLTVIFPINLGDMFGQAGIDNLARPGMLACMIGGSYPSGPSAAEPPAARQRIGENTVRAFNYPIGHISAMLSESAAKGVGFVTETGIGTFIDPRHGGGGLNPVSRADPFVKLIEFGGRPALHYPAVKVDVAIVRATSADENGNLTFEEEAAVVSPFTLAAAAKTNGGKVIAQVKRIRPAGRLDPRAVKVPGYMVDAVVVAPDQKQATLTAYHGALSGQERIDPAELPPIEDPIEAFLTRRVAAELHRGDVAVLGYGVCANIPTLLAGTGELDTVSFVIEQGAVGGIPLNGFRFGCAYNAVAYLDTRLGFDYLRGGGFDIALMSFLQIDADGNINVSALPARPHITAGIGGFMDIAYNAPRLVFAGQLRGGGSDITITPEGLTVTREGKHAKIVERVDEVTVPGDILRRPGRSVRVVTERCTFELTAGGLRLIEVVPGTTPADIATLCTAPFTIADNLAVMPTALFSAGYGPLVQPARQGDL
jgi:acyl CoA:acetate/3-ketoacid CoA transferase